MTQPERTTPRHLIWLLAVLLAWVGPTALAHELEHVFEQHQEPCSLHLYVGHQDSPPAAPGHAPAPSLEWHLDPPKVHAFFATARPAPYTVRAPPSP